MSYRLQIQMEALLEIQEAFNWYETQRVGLGDEFLEELEICYNKLTKHPQHYSFINYSFRRIKTNRFPYLLIYEIENNVIIINSVFHAKRRTK